MRPHHLISIALAPISVALLMLGPPAHGASPRATEAELKALNQKIDRMTQQVSQDALERERHSADLKAAEVSLGQARGELNRLNREFAERTARRAALAQARDGEQRSLDTERTALAGQLRTAYMLGREESLKLLLNQQ